MIGKVIQGSFFGGQPKLPQPRIPTPPPVQAKKAARPPSPPVPVFQGRSQPVAPPIQPRSLVHAPVPPAPAFAGRPVAVQRRSGAFAVEPGQVGLAASGGKPLPDAVRGKMEAALGANFSNVRVHVGPQAERIGAIAFTMGNEIYFAQGRYRPDTLEGQELLGHELAHVVQQRAGRVRNPLGAGLAVVQDHALEAEADRMGRHAAARAAVQAKVTQSAPSGRHDASRSTKRSSLVGGALPVPRALVARVKAPSGALQRMEGALYDWHHNPSTTPPWGLLPGKLGNYVRYPKGFADTEVRSSITEMPVLKGKWSKSELRHGDKLEIQQIKDIFNESPPWKDIYWYHGTSAAAAESILKEGFKAEKTVYGKKYGPGTYFSATEFGARQYNEVVIRVRLKNCNLLWVTEYNGKTLGSQAPFSEVQVYGGANPCVQAAKDAINRNLDGCYFTQVEEWMIATVFNTTNIEFVDVTWIREKRRMTEEEMKLRGKNID
jgi:hypothetical protein